MMTKKDLAIARELKKEEEALSFGVIKAAFEITDIPELHDRLIAGVARHLNLPLITNDPVTRLSG